MKSTPFSVCIAACCLVAACSVDQLVTVSDPQSPYGARMAYQDWDNTTTALKDQNDFDREMKQCASEADAYSDDPNHAPRDVRIEQCMKKRGWVRVGKP